MRKFLPLLMTVILTGCFQYTSLISIEPDGSGNFQLELGVPLDKDSSVTIADIEDNLKDRDGLHCLAVSVDTVDTMIWIRLTGRFDSPLVLDAPVEVGEILGFDPDSFHFARESNADGEKFHWYKSYSASNGLNLEIEDASFDPDYFVWEEKIVVPGNVVRHNADFQMGDTLIWKRRTMDVINQGLEVEVVWKVGY